MEGEIRETWMRLCEQAAVEQDHVRLLELVTRINDLLDQKEMRLNAKPVKHGIMESEN